MKVIFELDMNDEQDIIDYEIYKQAKDVYFALDDITTIVRRFGKHRDLTDEQYKILDEIQDEVHEVIQDRGIRFDV